MGFILSRWALSKKAFFVGGGVSCVFLVGDLLVLNFAATTTVFVFTTIVCFLRNNCRFSPLFTAVSINVNSLVASFFTSGGVKRGNFLINTMVNTIIFFVVALINLVSDGSVFDLGALFHLVVVVLTSVVNNILNMGGGSGRGCVWGTPSLSNICFEVFLFRNFYHPHLFLLFWLRCGDHGCRLLWCVHNH